MLGKIIYKLLSIAPGLVRIDVELWADFAGYDIGQRSATVGCLPDKRRDLIESEESRVYRRHHHHLAADQAGGNGRTARDVLLCDNASLRRRCPRFRGFRDLGIHTRLHWRPAYYLPDSLIWNKYQSSHRYLFYKLAGGAKDQAY